MDFQIKQAVALKVNTIVGNISTAIESISAFVNNLETGSLEPHNAGCEIVQAMHQLAATAEKHVVELEQYTLLGIDISDQVVNAEDQIEGLADRFLKWTQRRQTMSVKEACSHFNRSRTTIYRWIKDGKLHARKDNGRWVIVI